MQKSIFDFTDYRSYLAFVLPVKGEGRGSRARLAEHLGCKSGFVSLVISGGSHFSPEHVLKTSSFLRHEDEERDYFLLLLSYARAGSKDLEIYYRQKIRVVESNRLRVRERIRVEEGLKPNDQITYYSTWHYAAIHMSLYSPETQTKKTIATHFRLSLAKVTEVLDFLVRAGLVTYEKDKYHASASRTHLPANSPLVSRHHSNWRFKAVESLDDPSAEDLHYSLVMSASKIAAEKIREILLEGLQETEQVLKEARDEATYALTIDMFRI